MTNFEQYLENLMGMKKAEIINEGITWGIWANTEGNKAELMKWKKVLLARSLADRLGRLEKLLRQGRKPLFFIYGIMPIIRLKILVILPVDNAPHLCYTRSRAHGPGARNLPLYHVPTILSIGIMNKNYTFQIPKFVHFDY